MHRSSIFIQAQLSGEIDKIKFIFDSKVSALETVVNARDTALEIINTKLTECNHNCALLRSDKEQLEELVSSLRGLHFLALYSIC